uniref:EF-hand domain-containing protein n=1 Tax=Trichobilharzia regenti TaxID=157069 RepID=A0AA85KL37_TRIRE|nr:unnamed protein product [Trichobilharzia regenti]
MDGFTEVYFMIDKRRKGWITMPELRKYTEENDVEETMLDRWQTLFDPESTGRITLEKFCDVLGLQKEVIDNRYAIKGHELDDVITIQSDMPTKMKLTVCGLVDEAVLVYQDDASRTSAQSKTLKISHSVRLVKFKRLETMFVLLMIKTRLVIIVKK